MVHDIVSIVDQVLEVLGHLKQCPTDLGDLREDLLVVEPLLLQNFGQDMFRGRRTRTFLFLILRLRLLRLPFLQSPRLLRRARLRVHRARGLAPVTKVTSSALLVVLPPYTGPVQPTARVANPAVLAPPSAPVCHKCTEYCEAGSCALPFPRLDVRPRRRFHRLDLILLHSLFSTDLGGPDPRLVLFPLLLRKFLLRREHS